MRWRGRRQSSNVEDRRLSSGRVAGGAAAGGGIGMVILIIIVMLMGGDPKPLLDQTDTSGRVQPVFRAIGIAGRFLRRRDAAPREQEVQDH